MKTRGLVVLLAILLAGAATAAMFMYVRGVRDEARTGGGMVQVVVAKQDIPAGTDLGPLVNQGVFTTRGVPEEGLVEGAVTSVAQIQGQQSATAILAGEQIPVARLRGEGEVGGGLLGIPEGHEAITVPLDVSRAGGGALRTGDHVTMFATFANPEDTTAVLVPDVQVLKVNATGGEAGGGGGQLVTLALEPEDAQKVVFAQERGTVWLGLLPPGQEGTRGRPISYGQVTR